MRSAPPSDIVLSLGTRIEKFAREKVFVPNGLDASQLDSEQAGYRTTSILLRKVRAYKITNTLTLNSYASKYNYNKDYLSSFWHISWRFFGFDTSPRGHEINPSLALNVLFNFLHWQDLSQQGFWPIFSGLIRNFISMLFFIPLNTLKIIFTIPLNITRIFTELLPGILVLSLEFALQKLAEYRQAHETQVKLNEKQRPRVSTSVSEHIKADGISSLLTLICWLFMYLVAQPLYFFGRATTSPMDSLYYSFYDTKTYIASWNASERTINIFAYSAAIFSFLISASMYGILLATLAPLLVPSLLPFLPSLLNSLIPLLMSFTTSTFVWDLAFAASFLSLPFLALGTSIHWFLYHSSNYFPEEKNYGVSDFLPCFNFCSLPNNSAHKQTTSPNILSYLFPSTPPSNTEARKQPSITPQNN